MPKKKYDLRYLPSAERDLLSILDWVALDSSSRAYSLLAELDQRVAALASHPFLGRIPRDARLQALGYRVLVVEAYLVFYKVIDETVEVHRAVHGSRDLDEII